MKATWPTATARKIGLSGSVDFTPARVGLTLHVPCAVGKHVVDFHVRSGAHPDQVVKLMLGKGWTMGSKLACPDCSKSRRTAKKKEDSTMAIKPVANENQKATPTQSDAAKRAHRLVMMMLEEGYDEVKNQYRPGYTDASIAQETNASEKHVRETREQYFGPLGEPSEFAAIRTEVEQLTLNAARTYQTLNDQLEDARKRMNAICAANGWAVPA